MTERRSRFLTVALGLSLALHCATYFYFLFGRGTSHPGHRGVVTVDFIQPISHEAHATAPQAAKTKMEQGLKAKPHAPVSQPAPPQPPQVNPPTQTAGDPAAIASEASVFINSVARVLNQNKVYPKTSIESGEEGRVVVGLTMSREGQVIESRIEEPSGFANLNEAALQTVKNVGKFPAIPDIIPAPIHLHVPLVFQIESN